MDKTIVSFATNFDPVLLQLVNILKTQFEFECRPSAEIHH